MMAPTPLEKGCPICARRERSSDGGRGAADEGREERAAQRTDEVGEEDNGDEVDERTTQRTKGEVGREAASITGVDDDDENTGPVFRLG